MSDQPTLYVRVQHDLNLRLSLAEMIRTGKVMPVEPADTITLHPITEEGVVTHTAGEGENCRMEAHLPPGRYVLVKIEEVDDE